MASHELHVRVVSDSLGNEFLEVGVSNPDDPYDDASLAFTAEEAHDLVKQLQDALVQWKGETPVQPQPNWQDAPEWAKYWAQDRDGQAYWYEVEPYVDERMTQWSQPNRTKVEEDMSLWLPTWRNTLQERPQS